MLDALHGRHVHSGAVDVALARTQALDRAVPAQRHLGAGLGIGQHGQRDIGRFGDLGRRAQDLGAAGSELVARVGGPIPHHNVIPGPHEPRGLQHLVAQGWGLLDEARQAVANWKPKVFVSLQVALQSISACTHHALCSIIIPINQPHPLDPAPLLRRAPWVCP